MGLISSNTAVMELTSTDAQNGFGHLFEQVLAGRRIAVTRYRRRKMACIPWEEYERLIQASTVSLERLTEEFDSLRSRVRSVETTKAAQTLMAATEADFTDPDKAQAF